MKHKKLRRDKSTSSLLFLNGGVCQGISNYINLDVVLIRLLFVLVSWFWATGLIIYLLCWIVIPEE